MFYQWHNIVIERRRKRDHVYHLLGRWFEVQDKEVLRYMFMHWKQEVTHEQHTKHHEAHGKQFEAMELKVFSRMCTHGRARHARMQVKKMEDQVTVLQKEIEEKDVALSKLEEEIVKKDEALKRAGSDIELKMRALNNQVQTT